MNLGTSKCCIVKGKTLSFLLVLLFVALQLPLLVKVSIHASPFLPVDELSESDQRDFARVSVHDICKIPPISQGDSPEEDQHLDHI